MRSALLCLAFGIVGILPLGLPIPVHAEEGSTPAAPRSNRKRPPFPVFDEATVRKMIDSIDAPYNASLLKVGYFMRRGAQPFSVEEGYKALKTVLAREPVGTRKWYLQQSLVGSAAFRVEGLDAAEGFAAYDAIFKTGAANASTFHDDRHLLLAVHGALSDYVATVNGRLEDLKLVQDEQTSKTLTDAFIAYLALSKASSAVRLPQIQWGEAIRKTNLQTQLRPLIDKALDDPKTGKRYDLYVTAASVYAQSKPQTAVLLLQTAKPWLPKDDLNEANRFYSLWSEILAPEGAKDPAAFQQAIAVRREMVARYGRGQTQLLNVLLRAQDLDDATAEVAKLQSADANEREILGSATLLRQYALGSTAASSFARKQLAILLQSYMKNTRSRSPEGEAEASDISKLLTDEKIAIGTSP